jgi:hypothetical protein
VLLPSRQHQGEENKKRQPRKVTNKTENIKIRRSNKKLQRTIRKYNVIDSSKRKKK